MLSEAKHLSTFRRKLSRWYRANGRDLPWRRTRDPYAILVSEFMLQQTQVGTVIPYYIEWLRRFPNVAALAAAPESDVLHAWQGLGYYSRARNLHAAAKALGDQPIPRDTATIQKLPGVGRYTANAVATFAFDQSVPIVEANTARVLARLFDIRLPIDGAAGKTALWKGAAELLPKRGAGEHNSALMDLGAMVCLARQPKCGICPVRGHCLTTDPSALPLKKPRPTLKLLSEDHSFQICAGKILLEQSVARWRGLWILPRLTSSSRNAKPIYTARFPFTHHQITLRVFNATAASLPTQQWFDLDEVMNVAIPSPHRRALNSLLSSDIIPATDSP